MDIDPIVEEMRRHSAETAKKLEGDIHKLAEYYRSEQRKDPKKTILKHIKPRETKPVAYAG